MYVQQTYHHKYFNRCIIIRTRINYSQATSHRHLIDVETTSCVSWVSVVFLQSVFMKFQTVFKLLNDLKSSLDGSLKKQYFRRHADMNNKNWAFALSKKYTYVGAIQPCRVYWGTTNLKDEYASNKIVIKIFIFAEFGTVLLLSENMGQCQIKNFHFFRYLIVRGNVL